MTKEELDIQKALGLQHPDATLHFCGHCKKITIHLPYMTTTWDWLCCIECNLYSTINSFSIDSTT